MKIKVMKFGGTSVATEEGRHTAAMRVIRTREQGFNPVVVVSAIGRKGAPYATDTLASLLREIDTAVDPEPREHDMMIACGEIMSSVIFAHLLKTQGQPAQAFRGGQAGIRTDGVFGSARIVSIKPAGLLRSCEAGYVPVVCGFQGEWYESGVPGTELTTLGRGGSDTTAAALGAALRAKAVEIYTDVDGVKTADPEFVPEAPTLGRVSYDEVAEIAHLGAKVLHPRAAEVAMRHGIPLWVRNTYSDHPGTEIVPKEKFPGRRISGVTHSGRLVYVSANLADLDESRHQAFQARVYNILSDLKLNLNMITMSPDGIGFALPREQFGEFEQLINGLSMRLPGTDKFYVLQVGTRPRPKVQQQTKLLKEIGEVSNVVFEITESLTTVSVVGQDYMVQPGVFYTVLSTLQDANIPVLQVSDSDYSITCLIPETQVRNAVRALHDEFELEQLT